MARRPGGIWIGWFCAAIGLVLAGSPILHAQPVAPRAPLPPPNLDSEAGEVTTRTVLQPATPSQLLPVPSINVPPTADVVLPDGSSVTLPSSTKQIIRFAPRYGKLNDYVVDPIGDDVQRVTYTGGLKVNVVMLGANPNDPAQEIEFATDNAVIWVKGQKKGTNILGGLNTQQADPARAGEAEKKKTTIELYCSGNVTVQIRASGPGGNEQTIRAEELYYDLEKTKAIAISADLETRFSLGADPLHLKSPEIWRLGPYEWKAFDTLVYSSKRPADPNLVIKSRTATLTEQDIVRRNIFGRPYRNLQTGAIDASVQRDIVAERNTFELLGVPFFYSRKYQADLSEPLGPLTNLTFSNNRVFGFTALVSNDLYKLLSFRGPKDTSWILHTDYMSRRGPALGSDFTYRNLFTDTLSGLGNNGAISLYGIRDDGEDILGGFRGPEPISPRYRGRAIWTHSQDLFENGTTYARFMGQAAYLSDKNFFEQYYNLRYSLEPNQETFAYVYGARGNQSWSALGEVNVNRPWVTETQWLPRVDAAMTGESLFDLFVYSGRASAGYAAFRSAAQLPIPVSPGDAKNVDTARFDWNQRLSLPIDLGPARLTPYGVVDTTYYTKDQSGDDRGRVVGGGGVKASIPFSKLYAAASSELFNVRGLNHKIEFGANAYAASATSSVAGLPQLDRLNDDNLDLTTRSFRPYAELFVNGTDGLALATDPRFDAQQYAIRRVLSNRPETLDTIQVVQGEIRQRLQTKRGMPGQDHTVDWMSLDLSASFYPSANRDNYGKNFAFLEYNFLWNWGDRTAFSSSGWTDPFDPAANYVNVGVSYNRPDGSNFYLGYRHIDPVRSRALIAVLGYQLNSKYSITSSNVFDFGTSIAQSSALLFNRTGTDLTVSVGFTYNAFINNFGIQFFILPNAGTSKVNGVPVISPFQR